MKKLTAVLIVIVCFAVGCTNAKDTKRVLEDQGFTNVEVTGQRFFKCGRDYTYSTGFKAKSPFTGKTVTGTVCGGVFMGNSIKFD